MTVRTGALRSAARREWGPLLGTVRRALAARGARAVPLTLTAVFLTALIQVVQNRSWGFRTVQNLGAVRAEDPLWLALLRTPLSLFVPALDLPVWGALAQLLLVLGIAEITLGRGRTLGIAYLATLAGTLYARVGVAVGPAGFFGLPASDAQVVDTGPSAAVVGLAVYVCCACRAWSTGALVIVAMMVEIVFKDNLAGKEHLAAIAAVLFLCAAAEWHRHTRRRGQDRGGGGSGTRSGAPPMRS
ncbi:hypothetical protein OHA98_29800 [Streptomyces sp. NBC_00654]|uniref:hypothetical protein n=1 Tax=Streptomyces sp. NBC_00654 TaxID=2975799 RepID=UPI002255192D|nr:hypothetical protein [Streptomyces sp. NBC_00654]MCX4968883.1 hypothetical protein [Streptomyces sp. NBC_00654]